MLKSHTRMSTQQRYNIKAKEQLSNTTLSISEITYNLKVEYPSSFNKLL